MRTSTTNFQIHNSNEHINTQIVNLRKSAKINKEAGNTWLAKVMEHSMNHFVSLNKQTQETLNSVDHARATRRTRPGTKFENFKSNWFEWEDETMAHLSI